MYIKWKRYKLKSWPGYSIRVEAVESYRDEITGNPQTRYIGYLGSARENQLNDGKDDLAQLCFWNCVEVRLARLSISTDKKDEIRAKVAERIPRPTPIVDYFSNYLSK
jgi:hypothetical protein